MNVNGINRHLAEGAGELDRVLPHLVHLAEAPLQFAFEFGLDVLPREPGVILVRGPRQYGKSTWLEQQVLATVRDFGPGTAFYLNGDVIPGRDGLLAAVRDLVGLFRPGVPVKRLFIDEVTAIDDWQKSIKALVDGGALRDVLVVTTGSKAADLRRASERLPGRKGRLARTLYLFTPISYREFHRLCGARLGDGALAAYLLSGGAPIACSHVAMGRLPEHVVETVKDWVYGECAASGRGRSPLLAVLQCLARWGGVPLGQAKLAREAGLANNTVAAGYLELLADLMCVGTSFAWEASRGVKLRRKEAKFHFCNTLVAAAWHPAAPRSVGEIQALSGDAKGAWFEWGVAQELWRRAAIRGDEFPEETAYWRSKEHEIDFVVGPAEFLEVKAGPTNPLEFAWFGRVFPGGRLRVLGRSRWETAQVQGILHEDFFLAD